MSVYESLGLSIAAFRPTIDLVTPLYTPTGALLADDLGQKADVYEHEILANGGWWSARVTLSGPLVEMEDWFDDGLNRHIEVYGPSLVKVFEGFVDQVTLSAGTLTATRGPLMNVSNRVSVTYTPILDAAATPPLVGAQTTTTIDDNADSQAKYGILETVLSEGQLLDDGTNDQADQIQETFLAEHAWPESGEEIGLGSTSAPSVELSILGYVHRLMRYVAQDTTAATVQISNQTTMGKLQYALANDPNGMFSTDYSRMTDNPFLISRYENDNRTAWDIITEAVRVGDVNDDRYTFGIYDGRRAVYAALPTAIAYQHRIADVGMRWEVYGGGQEVRPWDVLPARWAFLPDFLVGRSQPAVLRRDPRYEFIESIRYTQPLGAQITGSKVGRLEQQLAKLGMRG